MSDFGADIFDPETPPPSTPPTKSAGRRKAVRKPKAAAADPETPVDSAIPADPEFAADPGTDAVAPRSRRPSRRPKGSEVPVAADTDAADAPAPKSRRRRKTATVQEPEVHPVADLVESVPRPLSTRAVEMPQEPPSATAPHLRRWTQRHDVGHGDDRDEKRVRVGVLLDLHQLQQAARSRGAELSFRKLLRNIAGERRVLRAVCYLQKDAPKPAAAAIAASGFEVHVLDDDAAVRDRMQMDTEAMPSGIDTLVLCPGTADQRQLGDRLAGRDLRVETAGFEPTGSMGLRHRQLGRECVFVP